MIINGGIVTYNPDIEKLKKNISRIAGQVCKLVIADNGSKNIEDIKRLAAAFENVSVILNYENFGIARALNQIMKWSSNNGGDWTITLDQDSECSDCIIDLYKPYLNKEDVGMLTCRYTDRNLNEENVVYNSDCEEIDFCITSASLLKNECWKKQRDLMNIFLLIKLTMIYVLNSKKMDLRLYVLIKLASHMRWERLRKSHFWERSVLYIIIMHLEDIILHETQYILQKI